MSLELLYTSAQAGLRQGTRGFCTVLCTQGMPVNLATRLETLSGYRHVYAPQDERATENPVCWSHLRLKLGGTFQSVLSRVSDYGVDYSGRTNKLAHHVVLSAQEQPLAGPAWLLRHGDIVRTEWDGQKASPQVGPGAPRGNQPPAVCDHWKRLTGDAGWGGILADAWTGRSNKPCWVVFGIEQRGDLLQLVDEAIALLPESDRWKATFSTYYTGLPPEADCRVRFVLDGSEEARLAAARGSVIDLTDPGSVPTDGPLVQLARTGRSAPPVTSAEPDISRAPPAPLAAPVDEDELLLERAERTRAERSPARRGAPPIARPPAAPPSLPSASSGKTRRLLLSGSATLLLILLTVAIGFGAVKLIGVAKQARLAVQEQRHVIVESRAGVDTEAPSAQPAVAQQTGETLSTRENSESDEEGTSAPDNGRTAGPDAGAEAENKSEEEDSTEPLSREKASARQAGDVNEGTSQKDAGTSSAEENADQATPVAEEEGKGSTPEEEKMDDAEAVDKPSRSGDSMQQEVPEEITGDEEKTLILRVKVEENGNEAKVEGETIWPVAGLAQADSYDWKGVENTSGTPTTLSLGGRMNIAHPNQPYLQVKPKVESGGKDGVIKFRYVMSNGGTGPSKRGDISAQEFQMACFDLCNAIVEFSKVQSFISSWIDPQEMNNGRNRQWSDNDKQLLKSAAKFQRTVKDGNWRMALKPEATKKLETSLTIFKKRAGNIATAKSGENGSGPGNPNVSITDPFAAFKSNLARRTQHLETLLESCRKIRQQYDALQEPVQFDVGTLELNKAEDDGEGASAQGLKKKGGTTFLELPVRFTLQFDAVKEGSN